MTHFALDILNAAAERVLEVEPVTAAGSWLDMPAKQMVGNGVDHLRDRRVIIDE
jgi:hypothetical protein